MKQRSTTKSEQSKKISDNCTSNVKAALSAHSSNLSKYFLKFFQNYGRSYKCIKRYGIRFISMMLIDAVFVLVFYLILIGGYGLMFKQYVEEIIPIAQSAGEMKSAQTFEEAKNITQDINMKLFNAYNNDKPFSNIYVSISIFVVKILLYILLLAAVVSISRALIWSMVKESLQKFWKFVVYDLMFTFLTGIIFILFWFFVRDDLINIALTILFMFYIYFASFLRATFSNEQSAPSIFRQIGSNLAASIKGFVIMLPAIIMILLTFTILFNIFGFIFQKLPQLVLGSISLVLILALICWSRIYYYEYIKEML